MDNVRTLIIGAGVSGLATAASLEERGDSNYLVLEASDEIGGYCKTVRKEGFVWDYSGHFFHFRHPEVEQWLRARMGGQRLKVVNKRSFISYKGSWVDFPFQKNIHQLPKEEFIDCLVDLYLARAPRELTGQPPQEERNFEEMLYARYGRAIAEKFLIPYNEKLYACRLSTLDRDAMGRFFPHVDLTDVIRNMRSASNESYNATFTYPEGGAVEYVKALASAVRPSAISMLEPVTSLDLQKKVATTARRELQFERLVSTVPFPALLELGGLPFEAGVFSWNKVLVFNLGFDRKGPEGVHWVYYPSRERSFYRVGFYDNIFESERMSLYVELGFPQGATVDLEAARQRVLEDLRAEGLVKDHKLVAEHAVLMDPAYVHVSKDSMAARERLGAQLEAKGVYSIGRYGAWTYCSIEDNILQARELVEERLR